MERVLVVLVLHGWNFLLKCRLVTLLVGQLRLWVVFLMNLLEGLLVRLLVILLGALVMGRLGVVVHLAGQRKLYEAGRRSGEHIFVGSRSVGPLSVVGCVAILCGVLVML